MLVEELTALNGQEQVKNDLEWIAEVINHKASMYTQSAKIMAINLAHYLQDHEEQFKFFYEYARLREGLLTEINSGVKSEINSQIDMFSGGEC